MKVISFFTCLFLSVHCFAGLSEDFEALKNLGRDFEATGTICEEVARLRFAEKFPGPQHTVVTGIEYSGKEGSIGELDLVVFDNATQVAQVIAEVKCWKSPKSGLKKAKEQRQRFLRNVNSSKALSFKWLFDPSRKLAKTQFNKANEFYFIAQNGSLDAGYDFELPYSLKELMHLRGDIIQCQYNGVCQKPIP
jgi:hypothetical protein